MKNLRFMFFVDCEEYSPDSEKKYWFDFMEEDATANIPVELMVENLPEEYDTISLSGIYYHADGESEKINTIKECIKNRLRTNSHKDFAFRCDDEIIVDGYITKDTTKKIIDRLKDDEIIYADLSGCPRTYLMTMFTLLSFAYKNLKNTDVRGVYDIEEATSDPIIMRNMTEDFYVNLLTNNKKYKNPKKAMKAIIDL